MPKRPTSLIILDCFQNEWKFLHETSLPDYLMLPRFGERVLKFCAETVLVDFDHRWRLIVARCFRRSRCGAVPSEINESTVKRERNPRCLTLIVASRSILLPDVTSYCQA